MKLAKSGVKVAIATFKPLDWHSKRSVEFGALGEIKHDSPRQSVQTCLIMLRSKLLSS